MLTSDGDVLGFGANSVGQLGVGNYDATVSTPTRMLSKKIFVKVPLRFRPLELVLYFLILFDVMEQNEMHKNEQKLYHNKDKIL